MKIGVAVRIKSNGWPDSGRERLRAEMRRIASDAAAHMRGRTAIGHDASNEPFVDRADGEPANLHATGRMVESLRPTRVTGNGFQIRPARGRDADLARQHQFGINRPRREWIGLSRDEISDLRDRVVRIYTQRS